MQRRRLAWLSALPLAAAGSAAAHSLAYRIVEPDPAVRSELLEGSGHAYLAYLPLLAALEPTFVVGLVLQVPFAVAAILLARALGGMAETIGRALASPPRPRSSRPPTTVAPGAAVLPRLPLLATRQAGRGPPS